MHSHPPAGAQSTLAAWGWGCDNYELEMHARPESPGTFASTLWSHAGMRLEPLGDKVIVKRLSAEEKTAGGILLPDSAREKPQQGRVLSVGEGGVSADGSRVKPVVQEGDKVLFTTWAGQEVDVDGDQLLILSERDILAVLN